MDRTTSLRSDAFSGSVAGTVHVGGDGEQAVRGAEGLMYVNLEDKSELAVFDPKTLEVKKRFSLSGGRQLRLDSQSTRAVNACLLCAAAR